MSQLGQAPERSQHGGFLQQESVAGRKVTFVQDSNRAVAALTLPAGGYGSFQMNLAIKQPPVTGPVIDWDNLVAWNYVDFFVDSPGLEANMLYRIGGGLSAGQQNIDMSSTDQIDAASHNFSHTKLYYFKNNDASEHTVYAITTWKYVEIA